MGNEQSLYNNQPYNTQDHNHLFVDEAHDSLYNEVTPITNDNAGNHDEFIDISNDSNIPEEDNTNPTDESLQNIELVADNEVIIPLTFRAEIDTVKDKELVEATRHIFPVGREFISNKQLIAMLNMFGETRGFTVSSGGGCKIICPKFGSHKYQPATVSQSKRNRSNYMIVHRNGRSSKCGCHFHVNHSRRDKPPIRITSACYEHTNGCLPSSDQLVSLRKKSGYYTRTNSSELRSVYIHLCSGTPISASQIRDLLSRIVPRRVPWSSQDVWNIRMSARRFRNSVRTQASFDRDVIPALHAISTQHHHDALDNQNDDIVDKAVNESQKLFEATLKESLDHSYSRFMVGTYMQKLKSCDPGFKYKVFYANDDDMTGYVYQTSDMRRNFELYGNFISVDMMKRQQNNLEWPYFGPVVVDGNNSVRVIGEACVVGESHEAYEAVLDVLFSFTPNRPRASVHIIASDCFINEEFMNKIDLPNAKLIWDRYHLISHVWKYGLRRCYPKVKEFLERMLDSYTEVGYMEAFTEASNLIRNNPNEYEYLTNSIHANRHLFARYKTKEYRGLMGKRGSSHSEQNHSSLISNSGPYFYDDLIHQLKRMLERQKTHCLRRRKIEADRTLSLPAIILRLKQEHPNHTEAVTEAANTLCGWGLEIFIRQLQKAKDYECVIVDGVTKVKHKKKANLTERITDGRCTCSDCKAFLIQCRHEIASNGFRFVRYLFDGRWLTEVSPPDIMEVNGECVPNVNDDMSCLVY